jgi:signal transduction histidine kinase
MNFRFIIAIYFLYGLAFFSMGLLVILEGNRASDLRLRKALRPLAGFGIVQGIHEWVEMFDQIEKLIGQNTIIVPEFIRLALLAVSFISLIAFGTYLLAYTETAQRVIVLVPLGLEAIWVFGLVTFRGSYPPDQIWDVADVWTRYILAMPGGLLSAIGLIAQQRAFRRSGLIRFGQDALWAAVAFAWYGLAGQVFVKTTALPPSNIINQELFTEIFGFPIQLFRAAMAVAAAVFVTRFLRAFQVEAEQKIKELQEAKLEEAEQKEALKGELYRRIVDAQEAERQRIARDLHDETGQALTAIGMGLRGISTGVKNGNKQKQTVRTLHDLETLTAHSLQELQRLIADLRPSHLDDLGLLATVRWYANNVKERSNLEIEIISSGEEKTICPEYSTSIFRILQEALTNITKHAEATKVLIHIIFDPDEVHITVEDNGRGFDMHGITRQQSWGLIGMEERATLLDGKFYIRSKPGDGTMLEIIIPYCPIHREEAQ